MNKNYSSKAAVIGLLLGTVSADQPVHCLRQDLYGEWEFNVSQDSQNVNLFETRDVCTHQLPNKLQIISADTQFNFDKSNTIKINLKDKYLADAQIGGSTVKGKWSTIYDQALKVELDNGQRYVANFRYDAIGALAADPEQYQENNHLTTGSYGSFNSQCDRTMVGFVQSTSASGTMSSHPAQCFAAKQTKGYSIEQTRTQEGSVKYAEITEHNAAAQQSSASQAQTTSAAPEQPPQDVANVQLDSEVIVHKRAHNKRSNSHLDHVPSDHMDLVIETINSRDLGWKADTCKLQKHHHMYDCPQDSELLQVDSDVQAPEAAKKLGEGSDFQNVHQQALKYQNQYGSAQEIPDSELPESHDWRNYMGYDFTGPIRNQYACGSCYTVAFTQVVEARLKLKYGKEVPELSPQMLLDCNYMNEGCEGGWPHFHAYLTENGHLVSNECAPYQASTAFSSCSKHANCPPVAKVKNTYDLGGAYGQTSEKRMMKEILRNGALNTEFQAPGVMSSYSRGIMSADGLEQVQEIAQTSGAKAQNVSDKTLNDAGRAWQNLNHSVVVLGWGVDGSGKKYWIVRNSYGPEWGQNGDFYVRRGQDDFGFESEQVAFDVELLQ